MVLSYENWYKQQYFQSIIYNMVQKKKKSRQHTIRLWAYGDTRILAHNSIDNIGLMNFVLQFTDKLCFTLKRVF